MATAILERNGTSVSIPLVDSEGGTPLVGRDIGKPNLSLQKTGSLNPRHMDAFSGLESYTLLGRFMGSSAFSDAITLTDMIKSNSNGNPLVLNIDMPEFDTDMKVAPAAGQDEALSLAYPPGRRNQVDVDLGLTRINQTIGGSDQPASTPTASGSGPVQISYRGQTVDISEGLEVSRSVGRPKSVIRKVPDRRFPNHVEKHKTAHDAFEVSFSFSQNTVSKVTDLVKMFSRQLNRESLTLQFNGVYGLGSFNVVPDGSGALRHVRPSGEQGTSLIPKISFRRVL